ncbi:unnamed protein product [Psylliodes chrysocephalus]|uniref:ATP-dependent DNA helicase n=1 Tax=Psylliodes chrysocephalus TaxID=3402493 RepID=A0A9P0CYK2_9CUCU|nr:unnamed protein product [Psylliodes chrysocephala]
MVKFTLDDSSKVIIQSEPCKCALRFPMASGIALHVRQTTTTASSVNANNLSTANTSNAAAAPINSFFQINPTNVTNVNNNNNQQNKKSDTLTAGDLLNSKSVAQLIGADRAFSFTKNMTTSPAFWADERKKLFAMIRQLGIPTFYITLTAADARWPELISVLGKVLHQKSYSDIEISEMSSAARTRLIQSDPVTVVRYFDNRIRLMMAEMRKRDFFKSSVVGSHPPPSHSDNETSLPPSSRHSTSAADPIDAPFANNTNRPVTVVYPLADYYYRVEFQHRGAPHIHGVLWLDGAPVYDGTNGTDCSKFIDNFVSASSSGEGLRYATNVEALMAYQRHTHSKSCGKPTTTTTATVGGSDVTNRSAGSCRYKIPFFPMRTTMILCSIEESCVTGPDRAKAKADLIKIRAYLNSAFDSGSYRRELSLSMNFDQLLNELGLTESAYVLAIRSGLKSGCPKVFLRRRLADIATNNYFPKVLDMHQANMDMQYIVDAYSCVSYIVNYINKSSLGMSKLMSEAEAHIKAGDIDTKAKLRKLGNLFLKSSEVSVQEAAYHVCGLRLTNSSRSDVFVNTFPIDKRVRVAKGKAALREMDAACTDVFERNILDRYVERPDSLETLCLARFATEFTFFSKNVRGALPLRNESGYVKRMAAGGRRKILRYRNYGELCDPVNFCHENVMLFVPYRDEQRDLIRFVENGEIKSRYLSLLADILREKRDFVKILQDMDELADQIVDDNLHRPSHRHHNTTGDVIIDDDHNVGDNDDIDGADNLGNGRREDNVLQAIYDDSTRFGGGRSGENWADDSFDLLSGLSSQLRRMAAAGGSNNEACRDCQSLADEFDFVARVNCRLPPLPTVDERVGKSHLIKTIEMAVPYYLDKLSKASYYFYKKSSSSTADPSSSSLLQQQPAAQQPQHQPPTIAPSRDNVGKYMYRVFNVDKRSIVLCAPTGKAAFNIGGVTIHSAFRLPVNQYAGPLVALSDDVANTLRTEFKGLKYVIIDEISMVGGRTFHEIDCRLQQIMDKQLPPVGDGYIFNQPNFRVTPYANIVGKEGWLWQLFKFFELVEVMRQKDDVPFAKALNNLAEYRMSADDIRLLESRHIRAMKATSVNPIVALPQQEVIPRDAIRLFRTNASVQSHNDTVLALLQDDVAVSVAVDLVKGTKTDKLKKQFLNKVRKLPIGQTFGLALTVPLHVNARYMITVNIDIVDGYVHGACGILKKIQRRVPTTAGNRRRGDGAVVSSQPPPISETNEIDVVRGEDGEAAGDDVFCVWLDFGGGANDISSIGKLTRDKYLSKVRLIDADSRRGLCSDDILQNPTWVPLFRCTRRLKTLKGFSNVYVERKQFPLTPAEALTVHKSQGSTYPLVALCLEKWLCKSHLYVGCSRATKSSGLFLFGNKFTVPVKTRKVDACDKELASLRSDPDRQLDMIMRDMLRNEVADEVIFPPTTSIARSSATKNYIRPDVRVVYHNVQSFRKHERLITSNAQFCRSDILCFVETWLLDSDVVSFEHYRPVYQINPHQNFVDSSFPPSTVHASSVVPPPPRTTTTHPTGGRKPCGILILTRTDNIHRVNFVSDKIRKTNRGVCSYMHIVCCEILSAFYIYILYLPTTATIEESMEFLKECVNFDRPLVIVGDFNVDYGRNSLLKKFLCVDSSLVNLLATTDSATGQRTATSTTMANTSIDWCLTNTNFTLACVGETIFSHHKPIILNSYTSSQNPRFRLMSDLLRRKGWLPWSTSDAAPSSTVSAANNLPNIINIAGKSKSSINIVSVHTIKPVNPVPPSKPLRSSSKKTTNSKKAAVGAATVAKSLTFDEPSSTTSLAGAVDLVNVNDRLVDVDVDVTNITPSTHTGKTKKRPSSTPLTPPPRSKRSKKQEQKRQRQTTIKDIPSTSTKKVNPISSQLSVVLDASIISQYMESSNTDKVKVVEKENAPSVTSTSPRQRIVTPSNNSMFSKRLIIPLVPIDAAAIGRKGGDVEQQQRRRCSLRLSSSSTSGVDVDGGECESSKSDRRRSSTLIGFRNRCLRRRNTGLNNADGVSCYANSAVNCLLNLPLFVRYIQARRSEFDSLFIDILSIRSDNTLAIRRAVGGTFVNRRQQDCQEFLESLVPLCPPQFVESIEVRSRTDVICVRCEHLQTSNDADNVRLGNATLMVRPAVAGKSPYRFQNLFRYRTSERRNCENCAQSSSFVSSNNRATVFDNRIRLTSIHSYLVLWFVNYDDTGRIQRYDCFGDDFNPDDIVIDNKRFRLNSAVYHIECQPPIQSQAISITSTDETKTETITANENQQIATKSELRPQTIIVQQKIDAFAEKEPEFNKFVSLLCPSYRLPTRKRLSKSLLPQLHLKLMHEVENSIANAPAICRTTDGWTSINNQSFIAVTAHYIDTERVKLCSNLLGCLEYNDSHTGANLCQFLRDEMLKWNIQNKVGAVVSDNAANILLAVHLGGWRSIGCFAHSLNLTVQSGIEQISDTVKKVKDIVEHFKRSSKSMYKLQELQKQMDMPVLKLKQDVSTKWNSTYDMLDRFLKTKNAIIATVALVKNDLSLTNEDWVVIEVVPVLKTFMDITVEVSTEKNVSLSKVIVYCRLLRRYIDQCLNGVREQQYSENVHKLLTVLHEQIHKRFYNLEKNVLYAESTILDPRFKNKGFRDESNYKSAFESLKLKVGVAINISSTESSAASTSAQKEVAPVISTSTSAVNKTDSLWNDFDMEIASLVPENTTAAGIVELQKYINEPIIKRSEDPLLWWHTRRCVYPILYKYMLKRLNLVATSVPCERIFSKAGLIQSEKRTRLSSTKMDLLEKLNREAQLTGKPVIKLSELELNTPHQILSLKFVKTKYGPSALVELETHVTFLPRRMNAVLKGEESKFSNREYCLTYQGEIQIGKAHPAQKFEITKKEE